MVQSSGVHGVGAPIEKKRGRDMSRERKNRRRRGIGRGEQEKKRAERRAGAHLLAPASCGWGPLEERLDDEEMRRGARGKEEGIDPRRELLTHQRRGHHLSSSGKRRHSSLCRRCGAWVVLQFLSTVITKLVPRQCYWVLD